MSNLRIYISPVLEKLETLNLNSRVNLIQRVLLGTLPQKELTSLPHIHITLTNLFMSSLRGYCYQFWAVIGSSLICPKSAKWLSFWTAQCQQNEQFENLYITSHGEARNIKFEQQGKPHSKGFIRYPSSGGTDVITPLLLLLLLFISLKLTFT